MCYFRDECCDIMWMVGILGFEGDEREIMG